MLTGQLPRTTNMTILLVEILTHRPVQDIVLVPLNSRHYEPHQQRYPVANIDYLIDIATTDSMGVENRKEAHGCQSSRQRSVKSRMRSVQTVLRLVRSRGSSGRLLDSERY